MVKSLAFEATLISDINYSHVTQEGAEVYF